MHVLAKLENDWEKEDLGFAELIVEGNQVVVLVENGVAIVYDILQQELKRTQDLRPLLPQNLRVSCLQTDKERRLLLIGSLQG